MRPSAEARGSEVRVVPASSHVLKSDAFKHPENYAQDIRIYYVEIIKLAARCCVSDAPGF